MVIEVWFLTKFAMNETYVWKTGKTKSRKLIERLFEEGKSVKKYPIRLVYLQTDHTSDLLLR